MKELRILLLGIVICLASGVKAQIYNSDVLFYVSENAKLSDPQTRVDIYCFKNGKCQWVNKTDATRLKNVCDNLRSNSYYYETHSEIWGNYGDMGSYDSKMSNDKWNVYSKFLERLYIDGAGLEWPNHTMFHAFKKDLSQYMYWSEPEYDDWRGGHNGRRVTYNRLTKSDILKLSFTGARDFLQ